MSSAVMAYSRAETLLSVENVSLTLGGKEILENVNVHVENLHRSECTTGQVVAFLGPSGVGKTQLLRILAGLQKPTTGEVFLGADRRKVRPGSVGLVAQNYILRRNRTVLGNLMLAAKQTSGSTKEAREKCFDMLKRLGVEGKADLYPVQMSGGQRQRVAIAQQLLCSEHFLLMDEPTAGLDPISKRNAIKLIKETADQDDLNTIIVVTHDIRSAIAMADTLWIMGRDRDVDGKICSGARIMESYDLIEKGLCWHPDVQNAPQFAGVEREILSKFDRL
jgi:ABC-type nitrate/sulfonate/bicarbonate transport system ATPase subunit